MIKKIILLVLFAFVGLLFVGSAIPTKSDTGYEKAKKMVVFYSVLGDDRFPSDDPATLNMVKNVRMFLDETLSQMDLRELRWKHLNSNLKKAEKKVVEYEQNN